MGFNFDLTTWLIIAAATTAAGASMAYINNDSPTKGALIVGGGSVGSLLVVDFVAKQFDFDLWREKAPQALPE